MMVYWAAAALALGLLIMGIVIMLARRMNNYKLIRDFLLLGLAPTLLFIAFIEFVVVPARGAQKAAALYPLFIVCWLAPLSILINRRLKK